MTECFITRTGAFLPNEAVSNEKMHDYIGRVAGEEQVKEKILRSNGIVTRHYALDKQQNPTHDIYELAVEAVKNCLQDAELATEKLGYVAAGCTRANLVAPGIASIVHDRLQQAGILKHSLEINSNAGICSAGAQAMVNAARAIKAGDTKAALCIGAEQSSMQLKSQAFITEYDIDKIMSDLRGSSWFMSVFLRFMLSDGAGACLLEPQPRSDVPSFKLDWTFSRSYANEAPLCMKLGFDPVMLSQDTRVLAKYMAPLSERALTEALAANNEDITSYHMIFPHMSSYFFERAVKRTIRKLGKGQTVPYWTNLKTAGNTGAASIYIMFDEYVKSHKITVGERFLLFVPESGQFNYVLVSLTVV